MQQQQRKISYQIADLTFTTANSQRDGCLMRFKLVPIPFPSFQWNTALFMPGKGSTTELTSSPQTRFHHLDTLYSLLSSAAQLQSLSWKTDRLASLGYQAVPHSKISSSQIPSKHLCRLSSRGHFRQQQKHCPQGALLLWQCQLGGPPRRVQLNGKEAELRVPVELATSWAEFSRVRKQNKCLANIRAVKIMESQPS